MIFITGDCHGDPSKLNTDDFPQQKNMDPAETNIVFICGDFGLIWNANGESKQEQWWLKWLNNKPFYTVFVPGNHENYDQLEKYPDAEFCGARVKQIREKVFMVKHGEILTVNGETFWCFGGASSHDIHEGILDPDDFVDNQDFRQEYLKWNKTKIYFRVKGISWWPQEMPSPQQMEYGKQTLAARDNKVDYIITHCCSTSNQHFISHGYGADALTNYFEDIQATVDYKHWYFGHYHKEWVLYHSKADCLYNDIIQIQ